MSCIEPVEQASERESCIYTIFLKNFVYIQNIQILKVQIESVLVFMYLSVI